MFTKLEAEKNTSTNYLLNTIEINYEEFIERIQEIVQDQQKEVEHFNRMLERAEQEGQKLAATHYAKKHMEIYDRMMNNIDILELAEEMKDKVIFFNDRGNSFIYLCRQEEKAGE